MALVSALADFILPLAIIFIMLSIGLTAQPNRLSTVFSKQLRSISLKTMAVNLLIIPITGFIILVYAPLPEAVSLVIFLIAIVPGAPILPALVHHNKGDMDWTLAMLFMLTAFSVIMVPIVLELSANNLNYAQSSEGALRTKILISYVLPVFVPLALALLAKYFTPKLAERLALVVSDIAKKLSALMLIVVMIENTPGLVALEVTMLILILAVIAVWSIAGSLIVIPAQKNIYISAAIMAALRNFAVVILLLDILTEDLTAPMYLIASSFIAMIIIAIIPYVKRDSRPASLH